METSRPSEKLEAGVTNEHNDAKTHSQVEAPKAASKKKQIGSQSEEETKQDSGAAIVSSSPTSSSNSLNQDETGAEASKGSGASTVDAAPSSSSQEKEKGKPKKDRSNLRKGKWTVEEEEYTSRIIHYFNTGLLNLPEGATLRSYLAEKLNCDPMRITKKYAGAACLGRRAQHYRDRSHPTVVEIQLARAELDHLERRFRIRIEEGHSSPLPMPPQNDLFLSLAQSNRLLPQTDNSQAMFQSWLMGMGHPQQMAAAISSTPVPGQSPWVLSNNPSNPLQAGNIFQPPWAQPPVAAPGVDTAMANLAFAQAAASLAPAITQLAAENLRQQHQQQQIQQQLQQRLNQPGSSDAIKEYSRQLQQGYEQSLKNSQSVAAAASRNESVEEKVKEYTKQLQESYEKQMQAPPSSTNEKSNLLAAASSQASSTEGRSNGPNIIPQHESTPSRKSAPSSKSKPMRSSKPPPKVAAHKRARVDSGRSGESGSKKAAKSQSSASARSANRRRSDEDKQAGEVLIGFLSSLRSSYEEALREKEKSGSREETESVRATSEGGNSSSGRQVTDISGMSSSQQVESSVEDSDWSSNKKTDPSSSEESDKEQHQEKEEEKVVRKGPPRKRLKG